MTKALAGVLAQMLYAGCPQMLCIQYIWPGCPPEQISKTTKEWLRHEYVLAAIEELNGAQFFTTTDERRHEVAIRKTLAEMAFFLWFNNFNDITEKVQLEKMTQARTVLQAKISGQISEDDPLAGFARLASALLTQSAALQTAKRRKSPELADEGDESVFNTGTQEPH